MAGPLALAAVILLMVAAMSTTLLAHDIHAGRLRGRLGALRPCAVEHRPELVTPASGIRLTGQHSEQTTHLMDLLRFNPDIPQQNIIPWQLVVATAILVGMACVFYAHSFVGWTFAAMGMPFAALLVARCVFGWERGRYRKAILEQLPDVLAMICRAVGAGIPLSEALRSIATDAPTPSREAFANVVAEVAIGQSLEAALWKLYRRVGLAEYAFFAVTIGLQTQTGGNLVETLQNLQDMVRKRVALSKRGKALAAEARMSAMILGSLPFVAALGLTFLRPGYLDFFFKTPTGNHLLLTGFGLLGTGILVMRQLIRRSLAP
jgi:tight adherence protein B